MPIYEYECEPCQLVEERFYHSNKQKHYIKCSKCAGRAKRKFSVFNAYGTFRATWKFNHGLGFTPTSAKQVDEWCEANGASYAGSGSYAPKPSKRTDKGIDKDAVAKILRG